MSSSVSRILIPSESESVGRKVYSNCSILYGFAGFVLTTPLNAARRESSPTRSPMVGLPMRVRSSENLTLIMMRSPAL